ncbi:unnamed protein product [Tuber melanosporum]|uniref:(Perigord truffle) hypothetical protein n=1 Tax=Tuber melanosporum (strain Mel28) TaxID=656061 RepID=D5GMZ2_TUBMM|nr:uncharacterized protein GSTUM_00011040001 [Tuber melanosporum]CAZ85905.1 unnamed protein product [Tuber melanosporum]
MPPSSLPAASALQPSDPQMPEQSSPVSPSPTKASQPRAILPKSSSINSKTNYISPYRQTPPSGRSVSSPLARSSAIASSPSATNVHSPNFKDIVNRFNTKQDEKVPNPSNRIPAVAAGPNAARARKPPAWKPAGGGGAQTGGSTRSNNQSTTGRSRAGERSGSAQSSSITGKGKNSGRARRPTTSMSNGAEEATNARNLLPPLDTSFNDKPAAPNRHRRSRSALEIHSPSAASLADTEGETSSAGFSAHPLRHRRSRSNAEIFSSPVDVMEVDAIFAQSAAVPKSSHSPRSVSTAKSNIPVVRHSPTLDYRYGARNTSSRTTSLAPVAVSSHGSRHTPQPSTNSRLMVYIGTPQPTKSPPLRSSRGQRLPTSISAAAPRQKFQNGSQNSSSYSRETNLQRGRGAKTFEPENNRGRDVKKKIPELGTVDFAARRARIQNAFNKTLKETSQLKTNVVCKESSKQSLRGEIVDDCDGSNGDIRGGYQERIEEEDENELGESPKGDNAEDAAEIHKEIVGGSAVPEPIESEFISVLPTRSESAEMGAEPYFDGPGINDLWDRRQSLSSSRRSSLSSFDERPPLTEDPHANQAPRYRRAVSGSANSASVSPDSPQEPPPAEKTGSEEPTIPVIVTPDMPSDPLRLMHIPQLLRPDSAMTAWSVATGPNRDSSDMRGGTAHQVVNCIGSIIEAPEGNQLEATTRTKADSISVTSDTTERANLSPMAATSASSTPLDDRATIVDVFDHYDEPREDFLKSYADTEEEVTEFETGTDTVDEYADDMDEETGDGETEEGETEGTETETETEEDTEVEETTSTEGYDDYVEDSELCDYTSCSEIPSSARPSIDGQSEGWETTSSRASPELDIHPTKRQSIQMLDSPTTPRQYIEEAESPLPPTPPPKDYHFLPPTPPAKDPPRAVSPAPSAMSTAPIHPSNRMPPHTPLQLPEIERDTEPLGLAINVFPTYTERTASPLPPPPGNRPSLDRWNTSSAMDYYGDNPRQSQDSQNPYSGRQSLDQYSHRPNLDRTHSYPGKQSNSPSSSFYSELESRHSSVSVGPNGYRHPETPPSSMAPTKHGSSSIHSQEHSGPREAPEQKLLIKRRHLLKELVDTESSYFRDMTVAMEIYKGSANACSSITLDDIRVLFGNTDAIVQFSKAFLESLKAAVGSVYVLRRARSGVNSSAVSVVNSPNSGDEDSRSNFFDDIANEEEKDRKTYVGEVFMDMFYNMEKVYGEYCKNHDNAVGRLQKLEGNRGVAIWLAECKTCAEDLTNAWNLESLLIKPVQRILKYPLLLTQLLECTPRSHPDFTQLEVAAKEMKFVADRINEMKKRKDMVERIVGRKRAETDIRHGITKGFARRAEKLKQSVGLSEVVVDEVYNRLFENYNMHFVQVQVIIRDIEIYTMDIQLHIERFLEFTQTIKEFVDISHTQHPEIEVKWRKFDSAMKEMASTYLQEHKLRVRKHSIEPLEMLLKMHESPQRIMTKRNKKAVDYARYKAIRDRGDTPDKKSIELADAYVALNETLIDELPKLFRLTKKLIDTVLLNFVELQGLWMNSWAAKLRMTFTEMDMPSELDTIVKDFMGDFSYNEQSLNHMGICNGTLKAMLLPQTQFLSPSSTLSLDAFEYPRRPSTSEGNELSLPGRDRALSLTSHSPTASSFDKPFEERRHSGGSTLSPLIAMAPILPILPQIANNPRGRAGSAQLQRSPMRITPPVPQRSFSTMTADRQLHTPVTRDYSPSLSDRPGSRAYSSASTLFDGPETQTAHTSSTTLADPRAEPLTRSASPAPAPMFSSAMPMEDDREMKSDSESQSGNPSRSASRAPSVASSRQSQRRTLTLSNNSTPIFVVASLYEFNIDKQRREGGFPYLTYVQGEIFDVVGTKGEIWLAKNQDDANGELGWIWCKHFARL